VAGDSPDWVARGIGAAALALSLIKLLWDLYSFWLRGRRVRVRLRDAKEVFVVEAHNAGNTPQGVTGWGFLIRHGRQTSRITLSETGPEGPEELPVTLGGGEWASPFSYPTAALHHDIRERFKTASRVDVRGFVTLNGEKLRRSKKLRIVL
jgi:hypothetical protein